MKIHVTKAFRLHKDDGTVKHFGTGVHDVPEDEGKHWFVRAHSEALSGAVSVPDLPPSPEKAKKEPEEGKK